MSYPDQYDVIAVPLTKNYSGGGVVSLLFYYDEAGLIKPIDRSVFPSGKCWIINDYTSAIEDKYGQASPFRINGITRTNSSNDSSVSPDNFVEWCCTNGNKVTNIGLDLIRIIECDLPNKDTGEINWIDEVLLRGIYFIKSGEYLYGPFEVTIDLIDNQRCYIASPYNTPSIPTNSHHITKIHLDDLVTNDLLKQFTINEVTYEYVAGLKTYGKLLKDKWDAIDYISASHLMKFVSELQNKSTNKRLMSNSILTQVKHDLELILKDKNNQITEQERHSRAISLLSLDQQYKNSWFDALSSFVKTDAGKKALNDYVVESSIRESEQKIKEIDEQSKKRKNDLNQVENEIQIRKNDLESLEAKIVEQEEQLSRTKEEVENKIRDQSKLLQTEILERNQALESLNIQYTELSKKHSQLSSLDAISKEIELLDRDKEKLGFAVQKLKDTLQTPTALLDKMTEVHAVMDILGYSQRTPNAGEKSKEYKPNHQIENIPITKEVALNIIHTIAHRIANENSKELSEAEVANFLICMQQNFITVLQGRPGVGKTSTAINLAKSLGIHDPQTADGHEADFLNIPVARGWSGSRDLLGFFNGLRGTFQPAKTGLYEFLLNGERASKEANIRIVLLDEANLSPIEHYWSDFIGLTDKEGYGRAIDTGAPNETRFLHPAKFNSLRFIATINNDSTTEPLSPRLLNRAPVISMDVSSQVRRDTLGGSLIDLSGAFGAQTLESLFGRTSILKVEKNRGEDLYEDLQKIINSSANSTSSLKESFQLEGRKEQSIIHYLDVAGELLGDSIAQDFALAQFILPHLKGDGEKVKQAIDVMIAQAKNNGLERSAQILEKISQEGDNYFNSYSFL